MSALRRHLWLLLVMPLCRYVTGHDQPTRHSSIPQLMAGQVWDFYAVDVYCTLPPIARQISFFLRGPEPHRSTQKPSPKTHNNNKSWNKNKKHNIPPANQQTRASGSRWKTVCALRPMWPSVSAWPRALTGLRRPQVGPSGGDWFLGGWCGSHVVALVQGHRRCRRRLVLC